MQVKQPRGWLKFVLSARTRILAWYIILMVFSSLVSILAIRQELFTRVQERVQRSLTQEVGEFRNLVNGIDPTTGQPFDGDIVAIFRLFLSRNIPDDDEFLLTILNGRLYKYSPRALPEPLQPNSQLIKHWASLTQPEQGQIETTAGELLYFAEPVRIFYQVEPIQNNAIEACSSSRISWRANAKKLTKRSLLLLKLRSLF